MTLNQAKEKKKIHVADPKILEKAVWYWLNKKIKQIH